MPPTGTWPADALTKRLRRPLFTSKVSTVTSPGASVRRGRRIRVRWLDQAEGRPYVGLTCWKQLSPDRSMLSSPQARPKR
jgi:hypothetical protein